MMELHILMHEPLRIHENIVKLAGFSWTRDKGNPNFISPVLQMEYAMYGTLADVQAGGKPLSYTIKTKLYWDVAKGLGTLHAVGIVHGDVKSENVLIFVGEDGYAIAKVCDFGTWIIFLVRIQPIHHNFFSTGVILKTRGFG